MEIIKITKVKIIEACDFGQKATIVSLDRTPNVQEMEELFIDESVILEF